jgi:hypothetical protein
MNPYLPLRNSPLILAYRQWCAGRELVEVPFFEAPREITTTAGPAGLLEIVPNALVPLYLSPDGLACWHPETTVGKLYVRKEGNGVWEYSHLPPNSLTIAN